MISKTILLSAFSIFSLTAISFSSDKNYPPETPNTIMVEEDFFATSDLVDSYKSKVIHKVFAKLKNAKGDFRTAKPALHFVNKIPNGGRIAVAYPAVGLIYFEEKMYGICISVGADSLDALAAVLSHELTHCYEKHTWEDNFKRDFQKTQMDSVLRDHYMDDEIQADYLGGFLAYSAGFKPFGIMAKLYEKEYAAYGLTDEALSGNYPPMKERVQIAEKSEEKLAKLINYFEMANFLVALEKYQDAANYFNAIEGEFKSREIYNNLGVVSFLEVIDRFVSTEMGYAFPVELDAESRLMGGIRGDSENEFRIKKLQEAIQYFEKAKSMDSFYPIAWLNLGCAQAMLGYVQKDFAELDYDEATISAKRAIRLAKGDDTERWNKTIVDAYILLGIIEAFRNNDEIKPLIDSIRKLRTDNKIDELPPKIEALKAASEDAVFYLDKALKIDDKAQLAILNKNILTGVATSFGKPGGLSADSEERIENKRIVELRMGMSDIQSTLFLPQEVIFAAKGFSQSKLLVNSISTDQTRTRTVSIYLTDKDYPGTTGKGIKIGNNYDEVVAAYPNPAVPLGLGKGYFLVYHNPKLIFQFDGDHKLVRWATYNP